MTPAPSPSAATPTLTPAEKRLLAFTKGSRYEGLVYRDRVSGAAVGATDGLALVLLGAVDAADAEALTGRLDCPGHLPDPLQIQTMVRAALRHVGRRGCGSQVSLATVPDEERRAAALEALQGRVAEASEALATAEAKAAKPPAGGRTAARQALVAAQRTHRKAQRALERLDMPLAHALVIEDTGFDLRLVHRVLRALGAKSGTLQIDTPYDAAVLVTDRGLALVMPCRMS